MSTYNKMHVMVVYQRIVVTSKRFMLERATRRVRFEPRADQVWGPCAVQRAPTVLFFENYRWNKSKTSRGLPLFLIFQFNE